jgi:hypothetical protein
MKMGELIAVVIFAIILVAFIIHQHGHFAR